MSRRLRLFAWVVVTLGVGQVAVGQEPKYKEIATAIVDAKEVKRLRTEVVAIVRNTTNPLAATDQKTLQDYYIKHIIAGMTRSEALDNPQQYPEWRKQIVGDLVSLTGVPAKHDFVRDKVYTAAEHVLKDKEYRPACRYNLVLLIGELNAREMTQAGGTTTSPPVPHAPARQVLLDVFNDPAESEAMKVGALIGLARHSKLKLLGGETDSELASLFANLLQKKTPDSGGSVDGLHWMQRISAEAVGDIGQGAAARLLDPLLQDAELPMTVRCVAASSLGRLTYQATDQIDANSLLKGLGQLALTSVSDQTSGLKTYVDEFTGEGRRRFAVLSDSPPEDPFIKRLRRQLSFQLQSVRLGLRGIDTALSNDAAKNTRTALIAELDAIIKLLEARPEKPEDLYDKLSPSVAKLEGIVKSVP